MVANGLEKRCTALCYVRLSRTQNASDLTSPERQKANIQKACDRYGWIPEWYEDTTGHKSGSKEQNRPEWLKLKARLQDADVTALVVNDQSRAMRNAWRAIKLFEELPHYGVKLHLAAIDRTIDISTTDGRMSAFLQAFMDDLYVLDAQRRAKDSVAFRKRKGQSIGIPPFGTIRNKAGLLIPSPYGAWFMPDGTFQNGDDRNVPPHPEAVWRGYYQCAEYILQIYRDNLHGYLYIANKLNEERWTFRDRQGNPRSIKLDDVRRVTSAWREYAGLVLQGKARDRIACKMDNPTSILENATHAVFDLDLLRAVAVAQEQRSIVTNASKTRSEAHVFALSDLLYCACCEHEAGKHQNNRLRSRLTGWQRKGKLHYRHSESNVCSCHPKLVDAKQVEDDFAKLIGLLQIRPEMVDLMAELAIESHFNSLDGSNEVAFEEQKRVNISKHRLALKNIREMFKSGEMESEEYHRLKDDNERQIAQWESRTSDRQKIKLELTAAQGFINRLHEYWNVVTGEDKKLLAHSLFEKIVYDLTTKRIVSFKIKAWAEPFVQLRASLYADEMSEEMKNRFNSGSQGLYRIIAPTGFEPVSSP